MGSAYIYDEDVMPIDSIEFTIWSNSDIIASSALGKDSIGINIPDLYENMQPKRGGLIDTRLGTVNSNVDCATCGLSANLCVGHFGHISLAEPAYNMGYIDFIKNILGCVCLKCSKLLVDKNEDELLEMLKNKSGKARFAEIRNLTSTAKYCKRTNNDCNKPVSNIKNICNRPVSKVKKEIKKTSATINIIAETSLEGLPAEEGGYEGKKKIRHTLTPDICYDILKNISDTDCMIMGINPKISRPEDMIHIFFPVPPVAVRPSAKVEMLASSTKEDDLTHKLADIIKSNARARKYKETEGDDDTKYSNDYMYLLQYQVATYHNNDIASLPNSKQRDKKSRSLTERLKGKRGRIRGNLMGKRVDFSARTVITPDPTIDIDQLGVPIDMAMNLTFPELVTPDNINELYKLVKNGRYKYPGANYVFPINRSDGREVRPFDLRYKKEVELQFGDIVERHLQDDDNVLLNRQPSLHKLSMMGHRAKILYNPDLQTFRLCVYVTPPYGADFDGDEMNIFVPQSKQASIELREIASVKRQVISPRTSAPIIGAVQDGVLGCYIMTSTNMEIGWRDVMDLLSYTSTPFEELKKIKKGKKYKGTDVFSNIIPNKINLKHAGVEIIDGKITKGQIKKAHVGNKANSIIHAVWNEYGMDHTKTFLDDVARIANNFNLYNGFTVGIGDSYVSDELEDQMNTLFETKKMKVNQLITDLENNPDLMSKEMFELSVNAELSAIRDDVSKLNMETLDDNNSFGIMIKSGSKGGPLNVGQMSGCVGQQVITGGRVAKKVNGRSLPYFHQNDDSAEARGFIQHPYIVGVNPAEYIMFSMAGREGMIDTAIKSVTGDTAIFIMDDDSPKRVLIGDWIDRLMDDNKDNIEKQEEKDTEYLSLDSNIHIPTTDKMGNVTWGKITAITRHDPTDYMYKIVTASGREVIVAESKSLLIFNKDSNVFEQRYTPDVNIGDCVPVTINLPHYNKDENSHYDPFSNEFKRSIKNNIVYGKVYTFESDDMRDNFILSCSRVGIHGNIADKSFKPIKDKDNNIQNDVVLDEIISIERMVSADYSKYKKMYDLTVPSTLNFGLANGLHVVDTAETGYIQRKLTKSMEDIMVTYDGTVRNANDTVHQFIYGDNGVETTKQYNHKLDILTMGNKKIRSKFLYTDSDLKKYKNYSKKDDNSYYNELLRLRDMVRNSKERLGLNYITFDTNVALPVNFDLIIRNISSSDNSGEKVKPDYVIKRINEIIDYENTKVVCMSKSEQDDPTSVKNIDELMVKSLFKLALYYYIGPKICTEELKLSKNNFDEICDRIIDNFNKAIVQPGEMVGCVAAQSLGEPLTQLTLNSFHHAGIGAMSTESLGVPRIKELLHFSKNMKTPIMKIYLNKDIRQNKDIANKIASHIKHTTMMDIRNRVDVYYDPYVHSKDGYMAKDKVSKIFYSYNSSKNTCQKNIDNLPWLIRIKLNKDKMLENNITLLDIKSKFCTAWERRRKDMKSVKKDNRLLLEDITQCAILSNDDNDVIPTIHIRFDMKNVSYNTISSFLDAFVDNFKLKGLDNINMILGTEKQMMYSFENDDNVIEKTDQYVIETDGINMEKIRYIHGIDLEKTICNDVVMVYKMLGVEAARALLVKEMKNVYSNEFVNYQHISIIVDLMTNNGKLTTIDRHGLNRLETDPLGRASFEKTVDQLLAAAVFGEVDHMKSTSSRIMAGLAIKGGTGLCDVTLNLDMIENSEYIEDVDNIYKKTFDDLEENPVIDDIIGKDMEGMMFPI